ncbi:N-acyl-L-amino acid amidohydrolase [Streptomyces spiroverticillatus]|uniref:N-acyl-L-amino acid amidohydrolase n=1 Tax=Streptomyces finlayi TaxID=67296 RepID=A0A919C9J7_9ACTN|nr:M20/M25/M40 family metallo-hydrolase [Streptomyces finlayi]GHA05861.1 N-acyl-L-amino acid amidohydrolase [Streptomyces spiroverticillatus]GHC89599.1 N-acyl-L-amino acid amidohydrolase [Streptomyces finlayi]
MTRENKPVLNRRTLLGGTAAAGVGVVVPAGAAAAQGAGGRGPLDQSAIDAVVRRVERSLVELRRDLHAHPETAKSEASAGEVATSRIVAHLLRAAGLEVTTGVGGFGVVGVLRGARPGRTVAYRADMDAVPKEGIFPGADRAAHACGHDIHTAVGVGVAQTLARLRHRLGGTVVFFFQPGEETLQGARAMIDAGVLRDHAPEEIHALHCGPFPVGQFAVTPGSGLPGQDGTVIEVNGPDALARAERLAAEITELSTVAPPETSAALERMVADVQVKGGPLARFVTVSAGAAKDKDTGRVTVSVWYRCWPEERYVEVRETVRGLARKYAGTVVDFDREPFPALVCPERDALALGRHLRRVLGPAGVTVMHAAFPFNGEDYALFLDRIPGTYSFLGVRRPGADIAEAVPHYATFDPDTKAIGVGVRAMAGWLAARAKG